MEIKQNKATAIYLALDDNSTGQTGMDGNDITAKNNKQIPIIREENSISLNKYKMAIAAIQRT